MKKQTGITLIALIITIIVMLILVGVTINVALNGGLIEKARTAEEQTQREADKEQLISAILGAYDKTGNYKRENVVLPEGASWCIEDGTKSADGNYVITEKGEIFYVTPTDGTVLDEEPEGSTYTAYKIGDSVTVGEESFYVIEDSDEQGSTVKLLAALNVETDSNSANYNKQNANAGKVAFDNYSQSYSNIYADSTIKPLVDSYVESLGVTVQEGRLMTLAEVEALGGDSVNKTTKDCPSFINATAFWLGSPVEDDPTGEWSVFGENELDDTGVDNIVDCGLRPVIVISKSNI